jgi:hypothetical protein
VLINGDELAKLLIQRSAGIRTADTTRLQRVNLSGYEEDD